MSNWTFGVEYEYADILMDNPLPEGMSWNNKDYSIVSSTGIANDPKGKIYRKGAEINTAPTDTYREQLSMFESLMGLHPEANPSYRTNLHLHIHVPGLSQDLDSLKRLLSFVDANQSEVYRLVDPIPEPEEQDTQAAKDGAKKRWKRRHVSHQYKVPESRVPNILGADTVEEFLAAHAPTGKDGSPLWGLTTRAGINLLQLKETDTVEFRHFTCTRSVQEMDSCFAWVEGFMKAALEGGTIEELYNSREWYFPKFLPYNHSQEIGYQWTNFDKNTRKVVKERIEELEKQFDIYGCKAEDIAPFIVERSGGALAL